METLLGFLVEAHSPPHTESLLEWWRATAELRAKWPSSIDRAIAGGVLADRLGFAFSGGYAAALNALVPATDEISALCATEEGGAHPRAIQTQLAPDGPGRYRLSGRKRWATIASAASSLLVVATTGLGDDGRPRLRLVRIAANATGVTLRSTSAPFVPEIPHAEIELDRVVVTDADILPGDGYDDYLKPFRTIEDLHVQGALVGYLIGVARRRGLPSSLVDKLLALAIATRAIAGASSKAETTHVALAGVLALVGQVVADLEAAWQSGAPDEEWLRWQRDRSLLQVAGKARAARLERAWSMLK